MSDLEQTAKGIGADARAARRTLKRRAAAAAKGGGDEFSPLETNLADLASRIELGPRKVMAAAIATDLRAANAKRLRANVQPPDAEAMTPRKPRAKGKLRGPKLRAKGSGKAGNRQQAMFRSAPNPKFLRKESTTGTAQVGFVGAMARIMSVHQYGQDDHVTRKPGSPIAHYPVRVVLGLDHDDRERILARVTAQVAP